MGADLGPLPLVAGAVSYLPANQGDSIVLVGDEAVLKEHLASLGVNGKLAITIAHAPEVVDMSTFASDAARRKNTSIAIAIKMHKDGVVDAVVSAGNTGAVMATAMFTLGRIPGVTRPAIWPERFSFTYFLSSSVISNRKPPPCKKKLYLKTSY